MKKNICIALLALICASHNLHAQVSPKVQAAPLAGDLSVQNQFIKAILGSNDGLITVLPNVAGNNDFSARLSFYGHSYFTCKIGSNFFTNSEQIANVAPNLFTSLNTTGVSSIIQDVTGNHIDTLRTVWPAAHQAGIEIIQDIFCIAFTKSGQVIFSWKFKNTTGSPVVVACQYLNDIDIGDPHDPRPQVMPDGPKILTRFQYDANWTQFPNTNTSTVPWFYIGFDQSLPASPSYNPGLSGMGYLTYGEPLNLITPSRYSNGDWVILATAAIFGPSNPPSGSFNSNAPIGTDDAILLEFPSQIVFAGKTLEVGRTSYGTGEYETCIGPLFSLVFYPHHLVWTKTPSSGFYSPNPIHIEKFVVNAGPPENNVAAANTKVTLTVSKDLALGDSICKNSFGSSQTKPSSPSTGISIPPGGVQFFDWWVCASPAEFCTGPVWDTLTFTATSGLGSLSWIDQLPGANFGNNECQLLVEVDCAELDTLAPQFTDTLVSCHSAKINVNDMRTTDEGLASVTWVPTPKAQARFTTDSSKFRITILPPITPCFTDKLNHIITISKLNASDSEIIGSFDFTFTDCLGHLSTHTVILDSCEVPDMLAPLVEVSVDSFRVGVWNAFADEGRKHDRGVDSIILINSVNMGISPLQQPLYCPPMNWVGVYVIDTTKNASACIRAIDCANNISDSCIFYVAPPDTVHSGVNSENHYILSLEANHPNPFSHTTTFNYSISQYGAVKLYFFDELGKEITRVIDNTQVPGSYSIDFDGSELPTGNYIVRLESGGGVVSRKVIIER